jgi:hypothetical protein
MHTKSFVAHRWPARTLAPVAVPADVTTASAGVASRRALTRFSSLLSVARADRRMGDSARTGER